MANLAGVNPLKMACYCSNNTPHPSVIFFSHSLCCRNRWSQERLCFQTVGFILGKHTHRPWKTSRAFSFLSWTSSRCVNLTLRSVLWEDQLSFPMGSRMHNIFRTLGEKKSHYTDFFSLLFVKVFEQFHMQPCIHTLFIKWYNVVSLFGFIIYSISYFIMISNDENICTMAVDP